MSAQLVMLRSKAFFDSQPGMISVTSGVLSTNKEASAMWVADILAIAPEIEAITGMRCSRLSASKPPTVQRAAEKRSETERLDRPNMFTLPKYGGMPKLLPRCFLPLTANPSFTRWLNGVRSLFARTRVIEDQSTADSILNAVSDSRPGNCRSSSFAASILPIGKANSLDEKSGVPGGSAGGSSGLSLYSG